MPINANVVNVTKPFDTEQPDVDGELARLRVACQEQLDFESLQLKLNEIFAQINTTKIDQTLTHANLDVAQPEILVQALSRIAKYFSASESALLLLSDSKSALVTKAAYSIRRDELQLNCLQQADYLQIGEAISNKKIFRISFANYLTIEYEPEKSSITSSGFNWLAVPLPSINKITGVLILGGKNVGNIRVGAHSQRFRIIAGMLAQYLYRCELYQRSCKEVYDLAHLERLSGLGQFAAAQLHQLAQPLAVIANNANAILQVLNSESNDSHFITQAVSDIITDSDRAIETLRELRWYLRSAKPDRKCFELKDAMQGVLRMVSQHFPDSQIPIQLMLNNKVATIYGDQVLLQQVFLNLISNSIHAINRSQVHDGSIVVRECVDTGNNVRISIEDNGIGISKSDIEHIFEPNYTTSQTGLGVGLSICRSIVEAHDGRLWAESKVERGVIFHIVLPNR